MLITRNYDVVLLQESVKNSLKNLLTYPFVVEAAKEKKVTLHGGYYDFMEGTFDTWDFDGKF